MNYKSQLIELIYGESLVQQGEILYESNSVLALSNIGSNLYVAKVKDGRLYEIEIQSPFAKKQKVSCECSYFTSHKICKHILAGLFCIRASVNLKKEQKEILQPHQPVKKSSTLNISHILEEITHDELVAFVHQYARQDKKFATQLKVNFARKIDLYDNTDKYKNILNAIIRPNTGQNSKASASDVKAIIHVLEDFCDQMDDCIALKQYREAFNIYESAFSKLEYIRHYYHYHEQLLLDLSKRYHLQIDQFYKGILPPDLSTDLNRFLLELCARSYYHFSDGRYNIIYQLSKQNKRKSKAELLPVLSTLLEAKPASEKSVLLALYLSVSGKLSKNEYNIVRNHTTPIIEVTDHLMAIGNDDLALKLLKMISETGKFDREVTNRLIYLYVRLKMDQKLAEVITKAYFHIGDIKYLDILKRELSPEHYEHQITKIENKLISENADSSLLVRLYKKEERWDSMIRYIGHIHSFEILKQNDVLLYRHERKSLIELYLHMISRYLEEHIGDVSHTFMEDIRQHGKHHHMDTLLKSILQLLKEKFKHRVRLVEIFES